MIELGLGGGLMLLSPEHGLYRPSLATHQALARPAGELVLRVGYCPIRWAGVELAGRVAPTRVDDGTRATLWSTRAGLIGQLPFRVTPFVIAGGELLGVASGADALGRDSDFGGFVGGGLKFYATRRVALRLGVAGMFHEGLGEGSRAHLEADLGVSVVFGRRSAGR